MFSYGSGAIGTMFVLDGTAQPASSGSPFTLGRIAETVQLKHRLSARREAAPDEFVAALGLRERNYGRGGFTPAGSLDNVPSGAYYLKEVMGNHNRVYARK
jgi:hydroxymethylglutaryl-CoA synthase